MKDLFLWGTMLACAGLGSARAQETPHEPEFAPLVFNVRPSRAESDSTERLARRARDLDFAFRSICTGCGAAVASSGATGPMFSPHNVLARQPPQQVGPQRPPASERTEHPGVERDTADEPAR